MRWHVIWLSCCVQKIPTTSDAKGILSPSTMNLSYPLGTSNQTHTCERLRHRWQPSLWNWWAYTSNLKAVWKHNEMWHVLRSREPFVDQTFARNCWKEWWWSSKLLISSIFLNSPICCPIFIDFTNPFAWKNINPNLTHHFLSLPKRMVNFLIFSNILFCLLNFL